MPWIVNLISDFEDFADFNTPYTMADVLSPSRLTPELPPPPPVSPSFEGLDDRDRWESIRTQAIVKANCGNLDSRLKRKDELINNLTNQVQVNAVQSLFIFLFLHSGFFPLREGVPPHSTKLFWAQ